MPSSVQPRPIQDHNRTNILSYLFRPRTFWVAILIALSAMIPAGIVKSGAITTLRCGGPTVVVPYCDDGEGHGALFHIWGQPFCLQDHFYRMARIFPQMGADGKPFLVDMKGRNMTRDWAGELKADWRKVIPEIAAGHSQALCWSYADGGPFDITYQCMIIRW